jgi:hypothetical protein
MRRQLIVRESTAMALSIVGVLAANACRGKAVRLIAGTSDTVVVNDRRPVPIPVYGLDASGLRMEVHGVQFDPISEDGITLSRDGQVTCSRRADAASRASLGNASTAFTLMCRPIRGFVAHEQMRLIMGEAPEELNANAVGVDGTSVGLLAGTVTVEDTTVVSVRDDRAYPRAPGRTRIDVSAGGCAMAIDVDVFERVDSTTAMQPFQRYAVVPLTLVGNELRAWSVAPGRYELLLLSDTTSHELTLGASASNCARWPGDGQRYVCIAGENASVIVRNSAPAGKGHDAAGSLFISRAFDSDRDTAFARMHPGAWLRTKWAIPEKPRPGELPCAMTLFPPKRG